MNINLAELTEYHRYTGAKNPSIDWRLEPIGLRADGFIDVSGDGAKLVKRIWDAHKQDLLDAAKIYDVPVELIIATIATESAGRVKALRKEPGYVSDAKTPHRVSPGLMQTLISTAQDMMKGVKVTREWLYNPRNSIMAGTAYIAHQRRKTKLDPPKVACAYNAGSVYKNDGSANRWKMRQYPIGTGKHADRFVRYFNDCFMMWGRDGGAPSLSFVHLLEGPGSSKSPAPEPPKERFDLMKFLSGLFGGKGLIRGILGVIAGAFGVEQGMGGDVPGVATQALDFNSIIVMVLVGLLNERFPGIIPQPEADKKK